MGDLHAPFSGSWFEPARPSAPWDTTEPSFNTLMEHYERLVFSDDPDHDFPKLDTFMGFDLKLKALTSAYMELMAAINQLNLLNVEAATAAFAEADLTSLELEPAKDRAESDWPQVIDTNIVEMQRSEAYLSAKSEYVTCLTRFQKQYRALLESFQEYNHMPTLSEYEDLSKTVHELKRDIWAMKKQQS